MSSSATPTSGTESILMPSAIISVRKRAISARMPCVTASSSDMTAWLERIGFGAADSSASSDPPDVRALENMFNDHRNPGIVGYFVSHGSDAARDAPLPHVAFQCARRISHAERWRPAGMSAKNSGSVSLTACW